jgi:hypothetical protein
MIRLKTALKISTFLIAFIPVLSCSGFHGGGNYHDSKMDFSSVQSVAVMPFANLTRDTAAAERVRNVFITMLLSSGVLYVVPPGEVARGVSRAGTVDPTAPSPEEVVKFAGIVKVDAVITGVVREYGEVRSGTTSANIVSFSTQMLESQTGRVVWSASTTKGGIGLYDRMLGGGGRPMNEVTEKAVENVLDKLFK